MANREGACCPVRLLVGLPQLDYDLVDLARKPSLFAADAEAFNHGRLIVEADISGLIRREQERLSFLDTAFRDALPIH